MYACSQTKRANTCKSTYYRTWPGQCLLFLNQTLVGSYPYTHCSLKGHRKELSHLLLVFPNSQFLLGLEEEFITVRLSLRASSYKATSSLRIWWGPHYQGWNHTGPGANTWQYIDLDPYCKTPGLQNRPHLCLLQLRTINLWWISLCSLFCRWGWLPLHSLCGT